jgi:hypothetical protein
MIKRDSHDGDSLTLLAPENRLQNPYSDRPYYCDDEELKDGN